MKKNPQKKYNKIDQETRDKIIKELILNPKNIKKVIQIKTQNIIHNNKKQFLGFRIIWSKTIFMQGHIYDLLKRRSKQQKNNTRSKNKYNIKHCNFNNIIRPFKLFNISFYLNAISRLSFLKIGCFRYPQGNIKIIIRAFIENIIRLIIIYIRKSRRNAIINAFYLRGENYIRKNIQKLNISIKQKKT
ncbi:hypothetical protein IMG5_072010 [Ichthyophthirius multifiliis]|uniref:Uncharacterized protein n=1 Tax=Ichthyophthirius multifiliis TaxID=5932 RepID=G0QPX0_ICHMU|nr:hypothetical protein IMG5_072010 [Ichthyophthirius multifiliis]EGR32748.1 hypothetical protein IMG5_072010 [Ichthyophthirius multifiliis]|eukprot:XP_004036734.1 hypothetical protein IMG5_072010 [Ichthyophthirius multifiliis]